MFIKNVSVLGTTLMLSSSFVAPGLSVKAAADSLDEGNKSQLQATETPSNDGSGLLLTSIEADTLIDAQKNELKLSVDLDVTRSTELDTIIQVSPNTLLYVPEDESRDILDETGKKVGEYEVDPTLNQIKMMFSESGFTKVSFEALVGLKKTEMSEQTIVLSIASNMVKHSVIVENQEQPLDEKDTNETEEDTGLDVGNVEETGNSDDESTEEETKETENKTEETKELEKEELTAESDSEESSSEAESSEVESSEVVEKETTESSETESMVPEQTTEETKEISSSKEETETKTETNSQGPAKAKAATATVANNPLKMKAPVKQKAVEQPKKERTMASTYSVTPQGRFIEETAVHAQAVAGTNDLYASVMIAQAILESGYGTSGLSSAPNYNLFGIKGSYNGQSVTMQTWEHFNGQDVIINAQFRKYPSYKESFEDNARVIKNTSFSPGNYYYSGAWKSNTNSYQDATAWLTGRYATDPNYNNKLNHLIVTHNLTQYDGKSSGSNHGNSGGVVNKPQTKPQAKPQTSNGSQYSVKSGDTLYGIALTYGVSVANLKAWNKLSSDTIYVGQRLTVTNTNTSTKPSKPAEKPKPKPKPVEKPVTETKPKPSNNHHYVIKSGDTLYGIGLEKGVSVANLKAWNHLSSDVIYVGQTLVLKGTTSANSKPGTNTSKPAAKPKPKPKPVTKPSAKPKQPTVGHTHTVQRGDTLYGISLTKGVSVANLKAWNNLKSDMIYPGQTLQVKGQKQTASKPQSKPNTPKPQATSKNHTVQRGDTLYGISSKYGVSVSNLKAWNGLTTDMIYAGQTLAIKGQKKQPVKQQTVAKQPNKPASRPTSQHTASYVVKSGDSLYSIATANKTTVSDLKKANNLSSDLIHVGQRLSLNKTKATAQTQKVGKQTRHVVSSGDTLWGLASKYHANVKQLKDWNNLSTDIIYKGQSLRVS